MAYSQIRSHYAVSLLALSVSELPLPRMRNYSATVAHPVSSLSTLLDLKHTRVCSNN